MVHGGEHGIGHDGDGMDNTDDMGGIMIGSESIASHHFTLIFATAASSVVLLVFLECS